MIRFREGGGGSRRLLGARNNSRLFIVTCCIVFVICYILLCISQSSIQIKQYKQFYQYLHLDHDTIATTGGTGANASANGAKQEGQSSTSCTSSNNNDETITNSPQWLQGPRLSNINEDSMTHELVQSLILHVSSFIKKEGEEMLIGSKDVLEQSMCLPNSPFLTWKRQNINSTTNKNNDNNEKEEEEEKFIKQLALRLTFLAIHEHQHKPAQKEALSRYNHYHLHNNSHCKNNNTTSTTNSHEQFLSKHNIGNFDYECPNTKFIIAPIPGVGFGASIRLGVPDPLFLGIISNRVVLFMNNIPSNITSIQTQGLHNPNHLFSCNHRKDYQCVYRPISPCVLTHEDVKNGYVVSDEDLKKWRMNGKLENDKLNDEKVLIVLGSINGHKPIPKGLNDKLVDIVSSLVNNTSTRANNTAKYNDELMTKWNFQFDNDTLDKVYKYISNIEWWMLHFISMFYLVRPNMTSRQKVNHFVHKALPSDFQSHSTIGLPIRGSDKCLRESECLSFAQYTKLIQDFAMKKSKKRQQQNHIHNEDKNETVLLYDRVILTSESKDILNSRFQYTPKNESFPFDFIVNEGDVGQGSGAPRQFTKSDFTADDVMISSLVSLKLQLYPESLLLNLCSNFHNLIVSFVLMGCGYVDASNIVSMKEYDNPDFQINCAWGKKRVKVNS